MPRNGYRTCAKCGTNRQERFFQGQRGRVCRNCRRTRSRTNTRNRRIFETYGLFEYEYDALLESQGGVCAICKQSRKYNLAVDHCHKTGRIRGLLCKLCNGRLLTAARDDVNVLLNAANYLTTYPCDAVLGERYIPEG